MVLVCTLCTSCMLCTDEFEYIAVYELVPPCGYYTYMITTTDQCTWTAEVKGGRAKVMSMVRFIYTYSPTLCSFSPPETYWYTDTTHYLDKAY